MFASIVASVLLSSSTPTIDLVLSNYSFESISNALSIKSIKGQDDVKIHDFLKAVDKNGVFTVINGDSRNDYSPLIKVSYNLITLNSAGGELVPESEDAFFKVSNLLIQHPSVENGSSSSDYVFKRTDPVSFNGVAVEALGKLRSKTQKNRILDKAILLSTLGIQESVAFSEQYAPGLSNIVICSGGKQVPTKQNFVSFPERGNLVHYRFEQRQGKWIWGIVKTLTLK